MCEEDDTPSYVKYWLSPDSKHDCYFIVGPESGPTERIGAYKAFLMGHSKPLRFMLQDSEQGDTSLVDVQPDTFRNFLKCLYMGCESTIIIKNLSFQECVDLLYVTKKYLVTHVKEELVQHLLQLLLSQEDYAFIAMSSPSFLGEKLLGKALTKIIQCKVEYIISSESFLDITDKALLWLLKLSLRTDEITLWEAVLKWASHKTNSHDGKVLRDRILKHLKFIRFCVMNLEEFCKKVVPTDILTHTEVYEICKSFGSTDAPHMEFICNDIRHRRFSGKVQFDSCEITFSHCVNNISKFKGNEISGSFKFLDHDWSILIEKKAGDFSFFLACESLDSDSTFEYSVTGELVLINHGGANCVKQITNTFCSADRSWEVGYECFCSWRELLNPSKRYVVNNSIMVFVHVKPA